MNIQIVNHTQAHETPWHTHQTGQLYWLEQGIIVIETSHGQWPITPGSIGWVPENCSHRAKVLASAQGYIIHVTYSDDVMISKEPGIYFINAFINSLLQRTTCFDGRHYPSNYITQLIALLGYEITQLEELPIGLPFPSDRRARNVADELLMSPSNKLTQEQLAHQFGVSVRTLSRLFIKQTGLTFSQWRQQSKIVQSLRWIMEGLPISEVAERSGYANVSTYIEVFRQRFGETPGKFQSKVR